MSIPFVDIAIIGGGPGGLALAQGLKKNGIDTAVFERDPVRADYVQGFRMRIRQRGIDALQANLPAHLYAIFLDTLGLAPIENLTLDEQSNRLDETGTGEPEDTHIEKSVSRITLRQILLSGLDDIFQTGKHFQRYELQPDGTVIAHFADGSSVRANLLVGADGTGSAVRRQLLPDLTSIDTGVRRLAGKITLQDAERHGISPLLTDFNTHIRPRDGRTLMITSHRVDPTAYARHGLIGGEDPSHRNISGFHFNNTTSYAWWNTAYDTNELGPDEVLENLDGAELLAVLLARIGHWDERIVRLIRHTDPSTVAFLKVKSSTPGAVWQTGPVTLLGDSIHAMTYFRALGGNTALYDTGLLVPELVAARHHGKLQDAAVRDYENAMRDHGYEAVRSSLSAMLRNVGAGRPLSTVAAP
ncbi:FAD-dependent monooxygenase [Rhizobium leguminosarum]|uniref:FAD-dependent oxidoreductase n=1 Tax=Rhizobium leguminosarum TaxID=384 RepID=UPI00103F00F5|nr:FAD-dependent monooxygenase [Rhizobium leguminosarum]MCA2435539.1 FAD-dependent monooxygenase [Rhizobium leguminosarum]NEJ82272.1 FAD-dependent monooxygenase [Rhizobium leguminosarum]NKJ82520.1 FAD-dependent monooxygenase [Rhizobium leguminosarum bv. viciae]NKM01076.1 FAD-dependent monooxygenase [Rhizobium leguminosarum bv. viciae]TBZ54616.1 FAD-dependent monooxygenase [Rhizobium leguminosarum bv. viciae]